MATSKTKRNTVPAPATAVKQGIADKGGKATPQEMGAEDESAGDARASKGKASSAKPQK